MDNSMKRVVFNRTPIMSTYLLAFIVGEFDYIEEKDSNGVLVRVYTPVGKKEEGQFALQVTTVSNELNFKNYILGGYKDHSILH